MTGENKEEMSNVGAIREFFGKDSREVTLQELKGLGQDERVELGTACKMALSKEV